MIKKTLKNLLSYGALIMVVIIGVLLLTGKGEDIMLGGQSNPVPIDLIGTRGIGAATTTTAVGFSITGSGGQSASTTYPLKIGNEQDLLIFSIYAQLASTSANAVFSVLGSNDADCDTTATSSTHSAYSTYHNTVINDIHWFDLGDHYKNKVHSTSLAVATTSISWINPIVGTGRELILEDLNSKCVALQVSGSSTALWVQVRTKNLAK